jgi:HEPN domain-containing protein
MPDKKLALAREWMSIAARDLRSARLLAGVDTPVYETALYHCQQAAEKAVKGYLQYHNVPFEKTHDVRPLITKARVADESFRDLVKEAALLTPYAQMFRYPEDETSPDAAMCETALAAAERIYRFVLAKHPDLDPEKKP